jgi:hypothetical protein
VEPVARIVGDDDGHDSGGYRQFGRSIEVGFLGSDVGSIDHDRARLVVARIRYVMHV